MFWAKKVDELMTHVLGKESSAIVPPSTSSTHNPNLDYHDSKV